MPRSKPYDIIDVLHLIYTGDSDFVINRDGAGLITDIVITTPTFVKTLTFTRDGSDNIINIDSAVVQL